MPPSLWDKSGFQICILVSFVLFAIITIACGFLNIHLIRERDELLEKINQTRPQRGISLESNVVADDLSTNREMMINGTVMDGVLVEGTLTLTVRVDNAKNGKGFPIDPHIPTVAPLSVIPTIRDGKKANIIIPKAPNSRPSEFTHSGFDQSTNPQPDPVSIHETNKDSDVFDFKNEDTPFNIDPELERDTVFGEIKKENSPDSMTEKKRDSVSTEASSNVDLPVESDFKLDEIPIENRPNVETRPESDSGSADSSKKVFNPDIDQNSKHDPEYKLKANATAIFPDHDIVARSSNDSEFDSLIGTNDAKSNVSSKGTQTDAEIDSASNETLPDIDSPTNSTNDADSKSGTQTADSNLPKIDEPKTESELLPRPLNAAVEELEIPSSLDKLINNNEKFLFKKNSPSKDMLMDHSVGSLLKIAKDLDADPNSIAEVTKIMQRLRRSVPISPSIHSNTNKGRKNAVFNKSRRESHLRSVPVFKNVLKSSFVGYPAFYGLWNKGRRSRRHVQHKESLRKSNDDLTTNDIRHPLSMNGILKEMMALKGTGAKMDTPSENHPFYMQKYRPKFANPIPQEATTSSMSTMQADDMTTMSMPPMQPGDMMTTSSMSTMQAGDMTTMSMSTMQADDMTTMSMPPMQPGDVMTTMSMPPMQPGDMTTMSMPTMLPGDMTTMSMPPMQPDDMTTMSMSTMQPGDMTTMSMSTMQPDDMNMTSVTRIECRVCMYRDGNSKGDSSKEIESEECDCSDETIQPRRGSKEDDSSEEIVEPDRDQKDSSEEIVEPDRDEEYGSSEEIVEPDRDEEYGSSEEIVEPDRGSSDDDFCDLCDGGGGDCVDCSDMRKLHKKFDAKKTAQDTLEDVEFAASFIGEENPILKKIDNLAKRSVGSVNRIQKSEHEQGSMKSNLDSSLFSIFTPRRKILRNTLQDDSTVDTK